MTTPTDTLRHAIARHGLSHAEDAMTHHRRSASMTTVLDTLKRCHALVWQYRAELEPYWPTPTTEHSLIFALSELGEVADATMRTLPQYARNNARDTDVLNELADLALMIITALEDDFPPPNVPTHVGPDDKINLQEIAWNLSMALVKQADGRSWQSYAYFALCLVAVWPGMDLPQRLQARLESIKAKRQAAAYAQVLAEHEAALAQARVRRGSAPDLLVGGEGA